MKILIGLGNPGERYARTRHNLGFMVIDRLAGHLEIKVERRRFESLLGEKPLDGETLLLVKPQTYVNQSGVSTRKVLEHYTCSLDSIMVICDDLNLPLGRLRIRRKGSSGGHNGLESITSCLGSTEFARLRIGIGPPPQGEARDYVLSPFLKDEEEVVAETIEKACEAAMEWVGAGIEGCMKKFN